MRLDYQLGVFPFQLVDSSKGDSPRSLGFVDKLQRPLHYIEEGWAVNGLPI